MMLNLSRFLVRVVRGTLAAMIALGATAIAPVVQAQALPAGQASKPARPNPMTLAQRADGVYGVVTASDIAAWKLLSLSGYELPAELVYVNVNGALNIRILRNESVPQLSSPLRSAPESYIDARGERVEVPPARVRLPQAPVELAAMSQQRAERQATLVVSLLFEQAGALHAAQALEFVIEGATLLGRSSVPLATGTLTGADFERSTASLTRADAALACVNNTPTPHQPMLKALTNPALAQRLWRVTTDRIGMHNLTAAALIARGVTSGTPLAQLQLWRNGAQVPLHIIDSNSNGLLDGNDVLRFYSASLPDEWNTFTGYTFAVDATSSNNVRMAADGLTGGNPPGPRGAHGVYLPIISFAAQSLSVVQELGSWREASVLDTHADSMTDDSWFARRWQTTDGVDAVEVSVITRMPGTAGTSTYWVDGTLARGNSGGIVRVYRMSMRLDGSWIGTQDKSVPAHRTWTYEFNTPNSGSTARIELANGTSSSNPARQLVYLLQQLRWSRPVLLNVGGVSAVRFTTPESGEYPVTGLPASGVFYDVTNPNAPRVMPLRGSALTGKAKSIYAYAANDATAATVSGPITPPDIVSPSRAAKVLYIGPGYFHAGVTPLINLRTNAGYSAKTIDIGDIYAWFSNGEISAPAIRSFLRHAYATWGANAPIAVTLVGDGSQDPFNRVKLDFCRESDGTQCTAGDDYVSPQHVPPYMLNIDASLGRTACDTCFVRVSCDDLYEDMLPDMWIGRLPVNETSELATLVTKLVVYETEVPAGGWQSSYSFFADNADPAGSFADSSEEAIALLPPGKSVQRAYFPSGGNAEATRDQWLAQLNAGPAVVVYNGHANRNQWAGSPDILFAHRDFTPARLTANGDRTALLQLSCETSTFHIPSPERRVFDEVAVLNPNGPMATFGSSGWDTISSHDRLVDGFITKMSEGIASNTDKRIGELTQAAYNRLNLYVAQRGGPANSLYTYLVFGDPMTPLRAR